MIKLNILPLFYLLTLYACEQSSKSTRTDTINAPQGDFKAAFHKAQTWSDTSVVVILPIDTSYHWLFEDGKSFSLIDGDLRTIDDFLRNSVEIHNNKQDTTKKFSAYIDLKKYKRQYIPFVNSKGEKKVYVNCFCISDWSFDNWKKSLVIADDGGSCFFQVTINLTTLEYEQFETNGYIQE